MSITLVKENVREKTEMRKAYCDTLIEMSQTNEDIVILDSDLMSSMGMIPYQKAYPDRSFNCGVQEANMMGVAAGLSVVGKIPYAHTFGPFASRRSCDQIFISGAYARANVRIVASDPGVTAAYNGGTHMPFEDLGIMRCIPEMTILEPTDGVMLKDLIRQTEKLYGMFFIRLMRKAAIQVFEEGSTFEIGKAITLREGQDLTIFANGLLVPEALKAHDLLKARGISARVVNPFTLKPIDVGAVVKAARETGAIVTAENHNIINGLGSAVAEVIGEHCPVPMERVGVQDRFGQVGAEDYLQKIYGLMAEDIVVKSLAVLERKK
jgi:transketolase